MVIWITINLHFSRLMGMWIQWSLSNGWNFTRSSEWRRSTFTTAPFSQTRHSTRSLGIIPRPVSSLFTKFHQPSSTNLMPSRPPSSAARPRWTTAWWGTWSLLDGWSSWTLTRSYYQRVWTVTLLSWSNWKSPKRSLWRRRGRVGKKSSYPVKSLSVSLSPSVSLLQSLAKDPL